MMLTEQIEKRSPQIIAEYREKLEDKGKGAPSGYPDRREQDRRGGCHVCGQDLYGRGDRTTPRATLYI